MTVIAEPLTIGGLDVGALLELARRTDPAAVLSIYFDARPDRVHAGSIEIKNRLRELERRLACDDSPDRARAVHDGAARLAPEIGRLGELNPLWELNAGVFEPPHGRTRLIGSRPAKRRATRPASSATAASAINPQGSSSVSPRPRPRLPANADGSASWSTTYVPTGHRPPTRPGLGDRNVTREHFGPSFVT